MTANWIETHRIPGRFLRRGAAALGLTLALLAAVSAPPARADVDDAAGVPTERPRDFTLNITDGEVRAVRQVGNRVVMGGTFTAVGPAILGAAGPLDLTTRAFKPGFPDIAGSVLAARADGAGGWYVGGSFATVGGSARGNVAAIDSAGVLGDFAPATNGAVRALLVTADAVYLGGDFTTVNGTTARRLARVDKTTGALVWEANVNGRVNALELSQDGSTLYLGGDFTNVAGNATRKRLAAVSTATGALTAFAPGTVNLPVLALQRDGANLLVAGQFTTVNGTGRQRLAEVDGTTGALLGLSVSINGDVLDLTLDAAGTTAYVVGRFSSVGGQGRNRLAAIALPAGTVNAGPLMPTVTGDVTQVVVDTDGSLLLGGTFVVSPEKTQPAQLARLTQAGAITQLTTGPQLPQSLTRPAVDTVNGRRILALERGQGSDLLVAGDFSDYGLVARRNLAAMDLATGALVREFDPSPDGLVSTIEKSADGSTIWIGGDFTTVGGATHSRIARIAVPSGAVDPAFTLGADANVKEIVRVGGDLYVGGAFLLLNGSPVSRLAVVDPTTGTPRPGIDLGLAGQTSDLSEGGVRSMELAPDGQRMMVIGNFRTIAGADRPLIAQLDVSGATPVVTPWRTSLYDRPCSSGLIGRMRDVDISPDSTQLFVVTSGHFYYPACDAAVAFPMAPSANVQPLWMTRIGDTLETVTSTRDAVFIGGHFRYMDTETLELPRFQVAALDPATGVGLNWSPNADGFRGVLTLEAEPAGLFIGTDGDTVGLVPHGHFGQWRTPTPGLEVWKRSLPGVVPVPGGNVTYSIRFRNTFADRSITVSTLTDTRLGSIGGTGTCTLPIVVPAGGVASCQTGTDAITGANADLVYGTVTATGTTSLGGAVSDTDRSEVRVSAASNLSLRLRAANGPLTVAYPGENNQFNLNVMNLDQSRTLTVTSLTSDRHGDLNGQGDCVTPMVIPPNGNAWCTYSGLVADAVGARPVTRVTASGSYPGGGTISSTVSLNTTVIAPAAGAPALLIVSDPAAVQFADAAIRDRIDPKFDVQIVDDHTVTVQQADAAALVIIGPSASATVLGARLKDVASPVLNLRLPLFDEMDMTTALGQGTLTGTTHAIVAPMHALAQNQSGTVGLLTLDRAIPWGTPAAEADVIATVGVDQATVFAYRPGRHMVSGAAAPACRVAYPANSTTIPRFTTVAWTGFDRAVDYATSNCGGNMIRTLIGTGSASAGADGAIASTSPIGEPWDVHARPDGSLIVVDYNNNMIRRISPTGVLSTIAGTGVGGFTGDGGPATAARLNRPTRVAIAADGTIYVADSNNNRIRRITPAGIISTVAGTGVAGFSGDNGQATAARLRAPIGVALNPAGELVIADTSNHRVRRVNAAGVITTIAGNGTAGFTADDVLATSSRLNSPYAVAWDAAGNMLIADYNNERVRMVNAAGIITTFAGNGIAANGGDGGDPTQGNLHKPNNVLVLPSGDVLITESNNNRVRRVAGGVLETVAGTGVLGFAGDGTAPIFAMFQRPLAVDVDAAGTLLIADRLNRRIRAVERFVQPDRGAGGSAGARLPRVHPRRQAQASASGQLPSGPLPPKTGSAKAARAPAIELSLEAIRQSRTTPCSCFSSSKRTTASTSVQRQRTVSASSWNHAPLRPGVAGSSIAPVSPIMIGLPRPSAQR